MSEANKLLAHQWFEQVWNQKDETAIDRMFHAKGLAHGFPDADSILVGPEAFKTVHRAFCGAFPDIKIEVEDVVSEGDRLAVRWKATMTHLGDHLGMPASGKEATLDGSSFMVVSGNQIHEGWNQMDLGALMKNLSAS